MFFSPLVFLNPDLFWKFLLCFTGAKHREWKGMDGNGWEWSNPQPVINPGIPFLHSRSVKHQWGYSRGDLAYEAVRDMFIFWTFLESKSRKFLAIYSVAIELIWTYLNNGPVQGGSGVYHVSIQWFGGSDSELWGIQLVPKIFMKFHKEPVGATKSLRVSQPHFSYSRNLGDSYEFPG